MSLSLDRAREFVYQHGVLWERALFAYLFEGGPRERVIRCLALYQNEDGGWAHALEHDIRTPASHAVAAEYALGVMAEYGLAEPDLVARTAAWCEANQAETGEFPLGESFHRYPRAVWWQEMTVYPPDAITGRLAALGAASAPGRGGGRPADTTVVHPRPRLRERTARWVAQNLTQDELRGLDTESWRYRLYHYADYFLNIEAPDAPAWREAIVAKVVELARAQPDGESALGFGWATSLPAGAIPAELIAKRRAALAAGQTEDGGWPDPHGLPQWRPMHTIWALKTLGVPRE
jgi:hypothetical protein